MLSRLLHSDAPAATLLIRLLVGGVFLSEGLQKFLYPAMRGAGRFERIGIPWPEFSGTLVASLEVGCGLLILAGLLTRLAAIPLIVIMLVALTTTKLPILLGTDFAGFALRDLPTYGFFSAAHESRTDLSMLLCSLFLLWVGAGPLSLDRRIHARRELSLSSGSEG